MLIEILWAIVGFTADGKGKGGWRLACDRGAGRADVNFDLYIEAGRS